MKNSLKTLAVWLIIGVILVVAISTILENSNTKLSYSDLIAKIDAGQVEKIELDAGGASATVKLKNDNIEKKVNVPSVDNLMENLQENMKSASITVTEKSESAWGIFLAYLTPIGIIVIFFIFWFVLMSGANSQNGNKTMTFGKSKARVLNPTDKNNIEEMSKKYLELDMDEYLENEFNGTDEKKSDQMNLFDNLEQKDDKVDERSKYQSALICYAIANLEEVTTKKLEEVGSLSLFSNIEMPLVSVLAQMQFNGMLVDESELKDFGDTLKAQVETLSHEICDLAGEEFNVNSHQQLGRILFEKLQLPFYKKTKNGYTTDVEVLEKLKGQHPIIEKILEYRTLAKLNSTYVEGLIPYINPKTKRIHSSFHQIITATGRISSTEPNLQNIPTRAELGKQIRKAFKPAEGNIYIDADYSQVELRVLAHISQDENMIHAFNHGEDIHKQAASKVLGIPIEEVTKEQRSSAKAVNFGIVYGISDFGLANQLGVSNKQAKEYISQYLEKYQGIKHFMDDIVESAKAKGYVETLFGRIRYIPEIKSSNYMVRQFGNRVAMNTPIQGTAADIMKIAMINVNKALKEKHINGKIVLQIHDELLLEVSKEDKQQAKEILKQCMENAMKLSVPLEVEISEGEDWYEVK